jgi:hypothetical protein
LSSFRYNGMIQRGHGGATVLTISPTSCDGRLAQVALGRSER